MSRLERQISEFLNWLEVEKRYSSETIRGYRIDLQQFHEFLDENDQECMEDLDLLMMKSS